MEMNPFKPLIQFYESIYEKKLSFKMPLIKHYLQISLVKTAT